MNSKCCFRCGEILPIEDFYRHPGMADGHLGKCKDCAKEDVRKNRKLKIDYYREYDRKREHTNQERKESQRRSKRLYRINHPERKSAQSTVNNAIRDGKLERKPCEICGLEPSEAHHDDYSKPFDVRWLCREHHRERHGLI